MLAIGCDLPPAPARPSRSLPLVSLFPAHAIALSHPSPSLRVMTRADSLAPLLQASDKAKKTPGQAKTRKGGKSRMLRPMDDLLHEPVLPGDPNYVADEEEYSEEWSAPRTVVSLGNSPVRVAGR